VTPPAEEDRPAGSGSGWSAAVASGSALVLWATAGVSLLHARRMSSPRAARTPSGDRPFEGDRERAILGQAVRMLVPFLAMFAPSWGWVVAAQRALLKKGRSSSVCGDADAWGASS
jgi:hypothetical protein